MDELIALLERYSTIPNEGESFEDIVKSYDKIIEILKQYDKIKTIVDDYYADYYGHNEYGDGYFFKKILNVFKEN